MAEVTYICKRTVVSTKPVQPGKHHSLSVLDRLMEKNHLRIVYYFQTPDGIEAGNVTKKLRESISETLTYFPLVIGRLVKDQDENWMIKCNDAGVRMVEARAKGSVEDWLKCVDREKEIGLVYWEDMYHEPYFWSTFYVQLTEFEEGGLAVGLSCSHLVADPTCATMFIKAWADTTWAGKMFTPPLLHPLPPRRLGNIDPNREPYTHLINHYRSTIERTNSTMDKKYTTISLAFSDPMVRACIEAAKCTSGSDRPGPSPFEALSGLLWTRISKLKGMANGLVDMSICLDMRKVLCLDKGFFGNCMVYNKVNSPETISQNNLFGAAKAIGKVISQMDNQGIMDLIEWLESNNFQSRPLMNGPDHLIFASLESVDPNLAMFEDGYGPIRVSYYIQPFMGLGQVLILPSPSGYGPLGRMVMVTLPEDEALNLLKDEFILQYSPVILMGINQIID